MIDDCRYTVNYRGCYEALREKKIVSKMKPEEKLGISQSKGN